MTVVIAPRSDAEARVWATALEVSELFADVPWVLIGAQMVMLLEREVGRPSGRTTGDVDVIVDVRVLVGGTRAAAQRLVAAGYEPADARHPYPFLRGDAQVDLLAPDHPAPRADLTTIPPATTTEIPGGSRALATTRLLEVQVVGVGSGVLSVPSLGGAIVLKVRAWQARPTARGGSPATARKPRRRSTDWHAEARPSPTSASTRAATRPYPGHDARAAARCLTPDRAATNVR
jgi:hypothetical protein